MQYRTQQRNQTYNSNKPAEETKPDLPELRLRMYTAKSNLTRRLYRTPAADELWSELRTVRYAEFMDLLEAEIKLQLLKRRSNHEVLNTFEIHKLCDEWGINDFHRSNILEWAVSAAVVKENHDPEYSPLTDISLFIDEKNHLPVFREFTDDAYGKQVSVFTDEKRMKLRAKLNSISASGDFITPKIFYHILLSFEVPRSCVSEIAEYVIALNRSNRFRNTPEQESDPEASEKNTASFKPETEQKPELLPAFASQEQNNTALPSPQAETKIPSVLTDHTESVTPFNPVHLFNMLDHREPANHVIHSEAVPASDSTPEFSHSGSQGKDPDSSDKNPFEQFYHELAVLLSQNSTQIQLFCDTPVVFLRSGEVKQINVFSAREEMPEVIFDYGQSVRLLARNYSNRTLTLTFSPHTKGTAILRIAADQQSFLKIVIFVL